MFRARNVVIGETSLLNVLDKIALLQEEAKHSKNPKAEYKIMFQYAVKEPVILQDSKSREEVHFISSMTGLNATIKLEDLLNFDVSKDTLNVTFTKEDIHNYLYSMELKRCGVKNNPENAKYMRPIPNYPDIHTEMDLLTLDSLYTDAQRVLAGPDKKYSKSELVAYARLHGKELFAELIKSLQDEAIKEIAKEIYRQMFAAEQTYEKPKSAEREHDGEMGMGL